MMNQTFSTLFGSVRQRVREHARARALMAEMSAMSDRELDDLNLSRSRLAVIARAGARSAA